MANSFGSLWTFLSRHPLTRDHRASALFRWFRWQVRSRMLPGPHVVPWVGGTRLLVERGMTGATGNIYAGLQEFEEMGFLLHVLRPGDLFVDVGANVGSYTILASGASRADSIAVEPIPGTFARLKRNVEANGIEARVELVNAGCGAAPGRLRFTTGFDTVNRVTTPEDPNGIDVDVRTLDSICGERIPVLVKVDVEGFEREVLRGAFRCLAAPGPRAFIVEKNDDPNRFGTSWAELSAAFRAGGYESLGYDPLARSLTPESRSTNVLWIRERSWIQDRVSQSAAYRVLNRTL